MTNVNFLHETRRKTGLIFLGVRYYPSFFRYCTEMNDKKLPVSTQIVYGFGMMGWSIMINIIAVLLIYVYEPPADSGIPTVITQAVIFGIFNAVALITTSGRFCDVIFDPLIAQFSDRSKNPRGRRIPFMRAAILPSLIFCFLVFYPLSHSESTLNIFWLALTLILFYVSSTTFIIPYNALLPELAPTPENKVSLSSWQSAGYVFGIGISSNTFNIADALQHSFKGMSVLSSMQYTVLILAFVGAIAMAITAFAIDERKYAAGKPSETKLRDALLQTLRIRNFRFFIVADFTYFIAITIISAGLIYFITILLQLPKTMGNAIMAVMVLVSFIFYPVVNKTVRRTGKKIIVIASLLLLACVFGGVYFLGKPDIGARVQIYCLVCVAAIPFASLNILPAAILAEIIAKDRKETGTNKEALFFAVRYFFVKIAQTVGVALFSMMLIYGKDVGHDFGIRLNGVVGFVLCTVAAILFIGFKEVKPAKAAPV